MTEAVTEQQNSQAAPARNVARLEEIRVRPSADVYRNKDAVRILIDVPGARSEDVEVEAHDGVLKVEARVSRGEELRVYERAFRLDRRLDASAIDASLKYGVLSLELPFRAEALPKKIEVRAS